jgi:hypothetical protein
MLDIIELGGPQTTMILNNNSDKHYPDVVVRSWYCRNMSI